MTDTPVTGQDADGAIRALARNASLDDLIADATRLRDEGHGNLVTFSKKVFIPLTHLCRDVCHYCTFAKPPRRGEPAYLTPDQVLAVARAGAAAGCKEALFTLGDKPEARYSAARDDLARLGHDSTISYLAEMSRLVQVETGLLPHANPGVLSRDELALLREVSVTQGIMLESAADRLCEKGGPHYGSPDKRPAVRLETIRLAGELDIPFTSGILIGIGETRNERLDTLFALRDLHRQYGHIQEIIVQNFRAKPDTKMARAAEPPLEELLWTIAVTRLIFGPDMNIQAPPNLTPDNYGKLIGAGINDWGGVSPVTPDHVNPEAPWPHLDALRRATAAEGKLLTERLAIYPEYAVSPKRWVDGGLAPALLQSIDSEGYARTDDWSPGVQLTPPVHVDGTRKYRAASSPLSPIIDKALHGDRLDEAQIVALFGARGDDFDTVCAAANELRESVNGDTVTYAVNRNLNYTNVCGFKCGFCAFSKGRLSANLRGTPYDLAPDEIGRRVREAWDRGATEVCMQGGIHPDYTGETYLALCRTVKAVVPDMHIHAFSPLEVSQGAQTLGIPVREFLERLKEAGLGSLPGTAAEILDDEIRRVICPDKLSTAEWLDVVEQAHGVGLRTTSTIMYGHVEGPVNWARHLLRLRDLQARTGGLTEFVPLPFIHMEAPIYLKGRARKGPTFREAVLIHAVARLALHPLVTNIQTSWVKMGVEGAKACLNAGANDLGGTLMNESISRAAGTTHGQEMGPVEMEALIGSIDRRPRQRTTLYEGVGAERNDTAFAAAPLSPIVQTPARKYARISGADMEIDAA